jgi:1,4-dihydroxy-6-naphthoate synthase
MNGVRRDLPEPARAALARAVAESVAYGLDHRDEALDHAMGYARGLDRAKADRFVGMYVNAWTRSAGERGRKAIALLLAEAAERGLVPRVKPQYQEY